MSVSLKPLIILTIQVIVRQTFTVYKWVYLLSLILFLKAGVYFITASFTVAMNFKLILGH